MFIYTENGGRLRFYLFFFFLLLTSFILLISISKSFICPFVFSSDSILNSIGTIASLVGILLAVTIFYLSEKTQNELQKLSEEIHSLSIMTYKNQSLQLLLDNHLKSPRETKERNYWHYRFSFENYDTLKLLTNGNFNITVKINGTNIAPFQSPAENIITYMYSVEVIDSNDFNIPRGRAYCSFMEGKKKISLSCNQLDLIDPMYDFEIIGPDILHSSWIADMPNFYERLKDIDHYQTKKNIH